MDDAASYVAAAVLDPETLNRTVEVASEQLSMKEIGAAYEAATGQHLRLVSRGPLAAGYAELERLKTARAEITQLLPLMYQLPMVSGKAKLRHVENARYPDVHPTTLAAFIKQNAAASNVSRGSWLR